MQIFQSLKNFISVTLPIVGGDKNKKRLYKSAYRELKSKYSHLFNPLTKEFSSDFKALIIEIISYQNKLRDIYIDEGDERYNLLINKTLEFFKLKTERFTLESIYLKEKERGKGGIQSIDITFKKYMLCFKDSKFKQLKNDYLKHKQISDVVHCDVTLLADETDIKTLLDLLFLLPTKQILIDSENDIILNCIRRTEEDDLYIRKLIHIVSSEITRDFIYNVSLYLLKGNDEELSQKTYSTTFIEDTYKNILENYKMDREKFLKEESQKIIAAKTKRLFADLEIESLPVYNNENSNHLMEQHLTPFKYIDQINIVLSFYQNYFNKEIYPVLKEFLLKADFFNKEYQQQFQKSYDKYIDNQDIVMKLPEDIISNTFSELHSIIKGVKSGLLNEKEKLKSRDIINKTNSYIDELLKSSIKTSMDLNLLIEEMKIDITSTIPKIISNVYSFESDNESLLEQLENISNKLSLFHSLMRSIYIM